MNPTVLFGNEHSLSTRKISAELQKGCAFYSEFVVMKIT
jgi:hypothetical protein